MASHIRRLQFLEHVNADEDVVFVHLIQNAPLPKNGYKHRIEVLMITRLNHLPWIIKEIILRERLMHTVLLLLDIRCQRALKMIYCLKKESIKSLLKLNDEIKQ